MTERTWAERVLTYVSDVNDYVEKGARLGWDTLKDAPNPSLVGTEALRDGILAALKDNQTHQKTGFRNIYPPSHRALADLLSEN